MMYQGVFETYSNILLRIVVPKFVRDILVRILTISAYLLYTFNVIDLNWLIISFVSIYAIAALLNLLYVAYIGNISFKPQISIRKPIKKSILYFTLYMVVASIGGNIIQKVDIFMVGGMMGLAHTAVYFIAVFMASIVEMPARSLVGVAMPITAEYFKRKEIDKINNLYKKIALNQFITGSLIFLLIWINIDNLFAIIPNGNKYIEGKWVVCFVGIGQLINSIFCFGNSVLSISKHYYYSLFFTFLLAGIAILGTYLFIPFYGIAGAALAKAISFVVSNICLIILVYKKINIQPFTVSMLKVTSIFLIVLGLNHCLPFLGNAIIDTVVRTIVLGSIFTTVVYLLKISPEVNNVIKLIVERMLFWKK